MLRAPSVPLITHDPYFSVWSPSDKLNGADTVHWTGSPNTIKGIITVDGTDYRIIGNGTEKEALQLTLKVDALISSYEFSAGGVLINLSFCSPLIPTDEKILSRPVTYFTVKYTDIDEKEHSVRVKLFVSEEICIDKRGAEPVISELSETEQGVCFARIGSVAQDVLSSSGDDLRINWGYFYLGGTGCQCSRDIIDGMYYICAEKLLSKNEKSVIVFAYDDRKCLEYFGERLNPYWKRETGDIKELIDTAISEYEEIMKKCRRFSVDLYEKAEKYGGTKYAELVSLAFRQFMAAHKSAVDENGDLLFISKECFSNGCAATVDVTYPSSPCALLYNTELLKGMLRPVYRYSLSDMWKYDFAPHDVGRYPLVNGQMYGAESKSEEEYLSFQMPVEECGNMLILTASICIFDGDTRFADKYRICLDKWVKYLEKYGADPENQLCTDDFAGHLAHNCNLSLKAIMGIAGYSLILKMSGEPESDYYYKLARSMAQSWCERAKDKNGYRLAFDKPDTFSMKYNIIWDKIWRTRLFDDSVLKNEFDNCLTHLNKYGMPLDNRASYTKADWLIWTACLADTKEGFKRFIEPLWDAYNESESRVPMTDWYDTETAKAIMFQNRSVIGGLFMKMIGE